MLYFREVKMSGVKGNKFAEKHGMYGTPIYRVWANMKARCNNPKTKSYINYGGLGISYSSAWEEFNGFYLDMGDIPDKSYTLERVNNDADYSKENCKWATRKEQANNTRQTVLIEIDGVTKCYHDWCKYYGLGPCTVYYRLKKGMSVEEALKHKPYSRYGKADIK